MAIAVLSVVVQIITVIFTERLDMENRKNGNEFHRGYLTLETPDQAGTGIWAGSLVSSSTRFTFPLLSSNFAEVFQGTSDCYTYTAESHSSVAHFYHIIRRHTKDYIALSTP